MVCLTSQKYMSLVLGRINQKYHDDENEVLCMDYL